jgi:hypothetical protein
MIVSSAKIVTRAEYNEVAGHLQYIFATYNRIW